MDIRRYQKQIILPEIDSTGQMKIMQGKVLCVGAGGLGSPLLLYLAAAGVGTIGIIDGDYVEISNLQRQILFKTKDDGEKKVLCARKNIHEVNPNINIHIYDEYLSNKNCIDIFQEYDVIVDGSDNFATKYLINDAAVKVGLPVVYASVTGFDGHVSIFDSRNDGPCYRCLYPSTPNVPIQNCAEAGILGSVVGIIGTIQSLQTLYVLLGNDHCKQHAIDPLFGRLLVYNLKNMEGRSFKIHKNATCQICSQPRESITLDTEETWVCGSSLFELNIFDLKNFSGVIIDVREENERAEGFIPASVHIPYLSIKDNPLILNQLKNRDQKYLIYCKSGVRSADVARIMKTFSFQSVSSLKGGYLAWGSYMK